MAHSSRTRQNNHLLRLEGTSLASVRAALMDAIESSDDPKGLVEELLEGAEGDLIRDVMGDDGELEALVLHHLYESRDRAGLGQAADDVLGRLGRALGVELESPQQKAANNLRDELRAELGLQQSVAVRIGRMESAVLARSMPGVVWLGPTFDARSVRGRALMAHELAHEAQRSLAGPADLGRAEYEAESIMGSVLGGGPAFAPSVALPPGVYAACGPKAMAEAEQKAKGPNKKKDEEDDKKKPPPSPQQGGGEPVPTPTQDTNGDAQFGGDDREPKPVPAPVEPQKGGDDGACEVKCPEPLPEHLQDPQVKTPPPAAKGEGEARTIDIAGHKIHFRLPKDAKAGQVRIKFRNADTPFEMLQLKSATLTLNESLDIINGQLAVAARLGKFIQANDVTLSVGPKGAVSLRITDARMQIGSVAKGKVDLDIGPGGISGTGIITAQDLTLGKGLSVTDGRLQVSVTKGGAVTAHGLLAIEAAGLGKVELDACFVDGEVSGKLTVTLDKDIPFGLGRIRRVQLGGCYSKAGWSLHGEIDVTVRDWIAATAKADLTRSADGKFEWVVEGDAHQTQPIELGPVAVHDAHVHVKWNKTAWEKATGEVHYRLPNVVGQLTGEVDLESGKVSGVGQATIAEPIDIAGFARLDEGHLEARLVDGELTEVIGSASMSIDYEGVPTFQVACTRAVYDVKKAELHAQGELDVLRQLVIGSPTALHATIPAGHAGAFSVEYGRLVNVGAGVPVTVAHGANPVGQGHVGFDYTAGAGLSGSLEFQLSGRTGLPDFAAGPLFLLPGGNFKAGMSNGNLDAAEANGVQWEVLNPSGAGRLCGQVSGRYDFGAGTGALSGQAWVHEDWVAPLSFGTLTAKQGGDATVVIGAAGIEALRGSFPFALAVTSGPLGAFELQGSLSGGLDPKSGKLDGDFDARLAEGSTLSLPPIAGYQLLVTGGTSLRGKLADNALVGPLGVNLAVDLLQDGAKLLTGSISDGAFDLASGNLSGAAALGLDREADLATLGVSLPASVTARLLPGTGLTSTIVNNVPTKVGGTIASFIAVDGQDIAQAELGVDWDLANNAFGATGYAQLLADWDLSDAGDPEAIAIEQWSLVIQGGSQVGVSIAAGALQSIAVQVEAFARRGDEKVATATIGGDWTFGDKGALNGAARVELIEDLTLVPNAGRFAVVLAKTSFVDAVVSASKFAGGSGQLVIGLDEAGLRMAELALGGEVTKCINGAAILKVVQPIVLSERHVGATLYGLEITPETQASLALVDSRPTTTTGALVLAITGNYLPFAKGVFDFAADLSQPKSPVSLNGDVDVFAPLPVGKAGDFEFTIDAPSNGQVAIVDGGLQRLAGSLHLGIAKNGAAVGKVVIEGAYEGGEAPAFDGAAAVTISKNVELFDAGPYGLGFAPSSFAATLTKGQITSVGGKFGLYAEQRGSADEAPLGSLTFALDGSYQRALGAAKGRVDGKGKISVAGEFEIAQAGQYALHVCGGSDLEATLVDSKFTKVDGKVKGRVDNTAPAGGETTRFLGLDAEGHYRPEGGGKLDVTGSATLLGKRRIFEAAGYGFWLAPSGGASAAIVVEANVVKSLTGSIGGEVHDAKGAWLAASVNGTWDAKSGKLDGVGTVRLARPMTFPKDATSGPRIEVLAANGRAAVVASQIDAVEGGINLIVHDATGPLLDIAGTGKLDAKKGVLERATGTVTLKRPIEVGDAGLVRIAKLSGAATIEQGTLQEVTGALTVELPHLGKGISATLSGGWALGKEGAKDQYWGKGKLALPLLDDGKRKLDGSVEVDVSKDGKWTANGQLDFQLAPRIKGKVGVKLDEKLDPEISANFSARGVKLVDGQPIFDESFDLLPPMPLGAPPVYGEIGIKAGVGLRMSDLVTDLVIDAKPWRPLSSKQKLPDFESTLSASWGLDARASIAAYLSVNLGIPVLGSVMAGIKAELALAVPVRLNPTGRIWGGAEGFGGELDVSLSVTPKLTLDIAPYVGGEILGFDIGPHYFDALVVDLGSPFALDWGTKYSFGDKPKAPSAMAPTPVAAQGTATQTKVEHKAPPAYPTQRTPARAEEGLPKVGDEAKANPFGGAGGDKLQQLESMMKGIEALGRVGDAASKYMNVMSDPALMLQPARAVELRKAAWEAVAAAGRDLYAACEGIFGSLKYSVPMWVRMIIEAPPGQTPTLFEAWTGADDLSREMVAQGVHATIPFDGRVQLVNAMLSGSCGDEDEVSILKVLEHASTVGEAHKLVAAVGVDKLLSDINGDEHDALVAWLDKAGIAHE